MKHYSEKNSQKNTSVYSTEAEKEVIKPIGLLEEIEPLLKEYFIGKFEIGNNSISMLFKNGQGFRLVAEEIC